MTLKTKLISPFLAITIFVVIVGVVGITTANTINKNFDYVQQEVVPSLIALGHLRAAYLRMMTEAMSLVLINIESTKLPDKIDNSAFIDEQQQSEEEEFEETIIEMEKWQHQYEMAVDVSYPEKFLITQELFKHIRLNQRLAQELVNLRYQDVSSDEILKKKQELEDAEDIFFTVLQQAIMLETEELDAGNKKAHQSANAASVILLVSIVIAVLLATLLGFLTAHAIIAPITQLKEAAVKIGQGQLDTFVSINSKDEVGILATTFNQMAQELKTSYEQLADYNRTLEAKVEERTQAFSQANQELQMTNTQLEKILEYLETTQQELVQSEKMAVLGQLVAGIAHEINTPLGAISSAVGSISQVLTETLWELPQFFIDLSNRQQKGFLTLLQKSLAQDTCLSSKEERQWKRKLIRQLEENDIEDADSLADILVEMRIYNGIEPILVLLKSSDSEYILEMAYKLSDLQRSSQTIQTASQRASKVVLALKSYAPQDQNREKSEADITEGIETALTLYHNQIKKGVKIIKHYAPLPPILGYPNELNQVWTNLIHNALQAMDYNGTLTIEICKQHEQVIVSLTDTGIGIPTEIQTKIFEAFFTTKRQGEGSGLGLDITRKIVEKHHGQITVESVPGKTTFTVSFPISLPIPHSPNEEKIPYG